MAGKRRRKVRKTEDNDGSEAAEDSDEREARINEELRASLIEEVNDEEDLSDEDLASDDMDEDENEDDDKETNEIDEVEAEEEDGYGNEMSDGPQRHYREPIAPAPSKFDVPTADEQRALRSADELLRSNLLVLQTKELLSEARALNHMKSSRNEETNTIAVDEVASEAMRKATKKRSKEEAALKSWLFELRSFLLSLENRDITAVEHLKTTSGLPISVHGRAAMASAQANEQMRKQLKTGKAKKNKTKSSTEVLPVGHEPSPCLKFTAPVKVDVVGAFMLGTLTKLSKEPCCVDVVMTMSSESLGPRDHVNCRYLDKKHLFLGEVARGLLGQSTQQNEPSAADAGEKHQIKKSKKNKTLSKESPMKEPLIKAEHGVFVDTADGDIRQCSLVVIPSGLAGRSFSVRLSVQLEPDAIPSKRLLPDRGNLRRYWNPPPTSVSDDENVLRTATPHYNAVVLSNLGEQQLYTRIVHSAIREEDGCPAMRDAMILGRVWLNARKASGALGVDTLTDKQLDYLLVYLLRGRKAIGNRMEPLQVFTMVLNFLASGGLFKAPVALPPLEDDEGEDNEWGHSGAVTAEELSLFGKHYEVVLVEPSMRLNVLSSVSRAGALELQREAGSSVALLRISDHSGEASLDAFQSVFLRRVPFSSKYDCYVTIPFRDPSSLLPLSCFEVNKQASQSHVVSDVEEKERRNVLDLSAGLTLLRKLPVLLKEALTDRVTQVEARMFFGTTDSKTSSSSSSSRVHGWTMWQMDCVPPGGSDGIGAGGGTAGFGTIVVGINCEVTKANRIVDRGPDADDSRKANIFRTFWGNKSELRRFKDGSIVEAVLWEADESTCGVIEQITKYILGRHAPSYAIAKKSEMKLPNYAVPSFVSISFVGSQVETYLLTPNYMQQVRGALEVFDELESRLKIISGATKAVIKAHQNTFSRRAGSSNLPLKVDTVTCLSPQLRYASLLPPKSLKEKSTSRLVEPLDVLVRFERSNGWPDNLNALRAAKTAFLIQICRSLEEFNAVSALPNSTKRQKSSHQKDIQCFPNHGFADIILKGYVFRIRILVEKEASLIPWPTVTGQGNQPSGKKKKSSPDQASFPRLSVDPLTASGHGALTPLEVQKRASMIKHGQKKVVSSEMERIAQIWGAYAPLPQRWWLRVASVSLPQHHSMIHGLAVAQRAFSPSLRLVLRWLAAHRFSHQLPMPLVELLVAHAFFHGRGPCIMPGGEGKKKTSNGLGVGVEGVPSSALHGLHRFLLLLTTHDWEEAPLIVQSDPFEFSSSKVMNNRTVSSGGGTGDDDEDIDAADKKQSAAGKKSLGLSGEDRLQIQRVFDQVKSVSNSAEHQRQAGHASASAMWVVAPYDRAHGWLSSWGVSHGAPSVDHSCFPGVGAAQNLFNIGEASSSQNEFDGNSHFNGVEKVVLSRMRTAAQNAINCLDRWVRDIATTNRVAADTDASTGEELTAIGWSRAFIPYSPKIALGANLKFHINSKVVLESPSSSICSGEQFEQLVSSGPAGFRVKAVYSNLRTDTSTDEFVGSQLVGMLPLEDTLVTLRRKFGHIALFFVDALCGDEVYVVWRPAMFMPTSFRMMESKDRIRVDSDVDHEIQRIPKTKHGATNGDTSSSESSSSDEDVFANIAHHKRKQISMVGVPDIMGIVKDMIETSESVLERPLFF